MLSSILPQTIGLSGAPAFTFHVDDASWRQVIAWEWRQQLRTAETISTLGADLKAGDLVAQDGTQTLYKLLRPIMSALYFGRAYALWEVRSINTPRSASSLECFYAGVNYRVLPKEG